MTMPTIPRILPTTALLLTAGTMLLLCSCQLNMETLTLSEARNYLKQPDTMSRGVDYLGSDAEFHYFEHNRELAQNVRFRISQSEGIFLPHETIPYRSLFPERRDAYSAIMGVMLTVNPDLSCLIEGETYASPAAVPSELWAEVSAVYFSDQRYHETRLMEQQLAPYLKNSPRVRYIYPLSGIPAHRLPQAD